MDDTNPTQTPDACEVCSDHGPLFIHARCHITAPLQISIDDDLLVIECYDCEREVGRFRIQRHGTQAKG